jgi:hypothetical protein
MWIIDVANAVKALIEKAEKANEANDALKFSQAACNVANAKACMMGTLMAEENAKKENQGTRTLLLTDQHSFVDARFYSGERLFCALVPVDRKREFLDSPLRTHLQCCTDKILFYAEDTE